MASREWQHLPNCTFALLGIRISICLFGYWYACLFEYVAAWIDGAADELTWTT
jgi:hypothetical protein